MILSSEPRVQANAPDDLELSSPRAFVQVSGPQERVTVFIRVWSGANLPCWLLLWRHLGMPHLRSCVNAEEMGLCCILAFKKMVDDKERGGTQWKEHIPSVNFLLPPTLAV